MTAHQSTDDARIRRFWDNYLNHIHKKGVKPPFDRWFVKRAEEYLAASPKRLSTQMPEDMETYLALFRLVWVTGTECIDLRADSRWRGAVG